MTALERQSPADSIAGRWKLGVRARLLLAFLGISAFAMLAAAGGIYAIREVGGRLDAVDKRIQPTLTSLELSRSAERIIAAAPALLAATDRQRRDAVATELGAEVDRLNATLLDLKRDRTGALPLVEIEPVVSSLTVNLAALEDLVARRLAANERIAALRRAVFHTNDEAQVLLANWLMVRDSQISALVEGATAVSTEWDGAAAGLAALIQLQRPAQTVQQQVSGVVDMLSEASTAEEPQRLSILAFQLGRALDELEVSAAGLDPKLRPLIVEQVAKLREFAQGPDAIGEARGQELALLGEGERRLAENVGLAVELATAIDALASAAEREVGAATRDALSVQRDSTRGLVVLVAMSLLSSILIVWLYVGRNIVRRLTALSDGMLAIAGGRLQTAVMAGGTDEIARMARAVEVFRRNTLERDDLLAEKARAAERLETQVKERTTELAQSVEELRALGEVSQAVNSSLDLDTVLNTIVGKATQLSSTDAGAIYVFDDIAEEFQLRATYGMDETIIAAIHDRHIRAGETAIGEAAARRVPIQIADTRTDSSTLVLDVIVRAGFRALLIVPLLAGDRIVGALVVRRRQPGEFAPNIVELLQTFAAQSVLAIQNARLFEEVEARTRALTRSLDDLRTAQDRLVQTEKLASLGQLTAGIAHEIKNPLNFVNNFSSLSTELIDELGEALQGVDLAAEKRAEIDELAGLLRGNLERVVQHGKRADSIVKNMLLHSRAGSGEHRPADINALVEESLNLAYHGARAGTQGFNITMEKTFDPDAGEVDVYPQDITRVLLNLISNGFYAATTRKANGGEAAYEPTLTATTMNLGDSVEVRIRDNGTGIPREVREKLFSPFFTTKPPGEGTGLGLSLSHDIIVKQHAGTIDVETEPGAFTEFRIVLPRGAALLGQPGGQM